MPHMFSDVRAFRRDPLNFLLERGNGAPLGLERLHLGPSWQRRSRASRTIR